MKAETKVGFAVFIAMIFLGGLVSITGDLFWERNDGYSLNVIFTDARGLGKGSYVFVSGVQAGKVASLALSPDGVQVVLSIPNEVTIPRDSSFIIATGGLLGESEIHVRRGTSPLMLEKGATARGDLPPSFDQILSRVEEDLQELRTTFVHINEILESPGVKSNLERAFNELPLLVTDTRDAATKISSAAESFSGMSEQGREEIARIGTNLKEATESLTQSIQENRLPLNRTMENLQSATTRIETILSDFDYDNKAGTELRETLSTVGRAAHELEKLLIETRKAFSGEGAEEHPVTRLHDVVDKADRVLGQIDRIQLDGQIGAHQVTSGERNDRLMDLSFRLHQRGSKWSFETGVEDLGDEERFNALLGWDWNSLVSLKGGIVRGDVGGGLTLDFTEDLGLPLETSWLWWDDEGGQWKSDTLLKIKKHWGILYRHLDLEEENRDSLGLFYRF